MEGVWRIVRSARQQRLMEAHPGVSFNLVLDDPRRYLGGVNVYPVLVELVICQVWPLLGEDEQALEVPPVRTRMRIGEKCCERNEANGNDSRSEEVCKHFEQDLLRRSLSSVIFTSLVELFISPHHGMPISSPSA